jgi:hypothetical protein
MISGARRLFFILCAQVCAMLTGCASNSANALLKYQPPARESPAAIIDVGKHGRAWSVDGTETPSFANTLRLAPGEHRVGLNCLSYDISTAAVISAAAATCLKNLHLYARVVVRISNGGAARVCSNNWLERSRGRGFVEQ